MASRSMTKFATTRVHKPWSEMNEFERARHYARRWELEEQEKKTGKKKKKKY